MQVYRSMIKARFSTGLFKLNQTTPIKFRTFICCSCGVPNRIKNENLLRYENINISSNCVINKEQRRDSSYYTFPLFTGTQHVLETFHIYSMLPWWATITCTTILLRSCITLPLSVKQNKLMSKMELLKPTLKEITDAVKHNIVVRGQRAGKSKIEIQTELIKELKLYTSDFYERNGVTPWKMFVLPWLQLPLWVTVSFALRNIAGYVPKDGLQENEVYLPSVGVETEGLLWFSDLSIADPYYILPGILLVTNLMNIELSTLRNQAPSTFSKVITRVFRGLTCMIFFVATQVPSAMSLYWSCSSTYGLAQNLILKFPAVRRKFNIPKTPTEKEKPFKNIVNILNLRAKKFVELQRKK